MDQDKRRFLKAAALTSPLLLTCSARSETAVAAAATVVTPLEFGAVGDGSTDDTAALKDAYAAAKEQKRRLWLPVGEYRFTSTLVWDGSVEVAGENRRYSVLLKAGNFTGIRIGGGGRHTSYMDFTVRQNGEGTGHGIVVGEDGHLALNRLGIENHGGTGLFLQYDRPTGYNSEYSNLYILHNGGDGIRVTHQYAAFFENVNCFGNGGYGFNNDSGDYNRGIHIICSENAAGGARINGLYNVFELYGEKNTGADITLTSTTYQNLITVLHADSTAKIVDNGTRNTVIAIMPNAVAGFSHVAIGERFNQVSNASIALEFFGTSKVMRLPRLSTVQRDALGANTVDGMMIYNTTTAKVQAVLNGVWTNL